MINTMHKVMGYYAVESQELDASDNSQRLLEGNDYKLSTCTYTYYRKNQSNLSRDAWGMII